jgi:glycosyltransferase involved in cell wall biosynthesis
VPSSYGFLSTYPPTQCGLATFTAALRGSLNSEAHGDRAGVVRVVDGPVTSQTPEVVGYLQNGAPDAHRVAAEALNSFDVAVIQHEYAIYGGPDGDGILAVLDGLRVPTVVIAHTVLADPTPHQRHVLEQVVSAADAVVTMTEAARQRLITGYDIDATKIALIPHGASSRGNHDGAPAGSRPMILTWGLLGPGKGIEWAIDGLQQLRRLQPLPEYVVAGQTHPRVRQRQGESYRIQLGNRARAVGVAGLVRFERTYLDDAALTRLIRRADVVLVPYDSRELVTSGVLAEAVAAGKPVVATAFPHAVELLSGDTGLLVPQYDGAAIGAALYRVLTEPDLARRMAAEASRLAPQMRWSTVADQYRSLAARLLATRTSVAS